MSAAAWVVLIGLFVWFYLLEEARMEREGLKGTARWPERRASKRR